MKEHATCSSTQLLYFLHFSFNYPNILNSATFSLQRKTNMPQKLKAYWIRFIYLKFIFNVIFT